MSCSDIKSGLPDDIARDRTTTPAVIRARIQRTVITLPTPWYHTPAWVRFSDRIAHGARFDVQKPGCRIHRVYRQVQVAACARVGTLMTGKRKRDLAVRPWEQNAVQELG